MKNVKKIVGIIAMVAIIGFSFAACKYDCDICGGSGICRDCQGTGEIVSGYTYTCESCDGSGKCFNCDGEGYEIHVGGK